MHLNETKFYYNQYADLIDKYFPDGYQYSLIFNEKYSNLSLFEQNNLYLSEFGNINHNSSVLDMGCGNGQFYKFIKKKFNCNYKGIDLSENQIKNCKQKYGPNIFECADMHTYKTNEKFDICYLIESIGYSNNIQLLANNINSLLNPGGEVIIKFPSKVINDHKKHLEVENLFESVKKEYGFCQNSLGIVISKEDIEKSFLENNFKLINYKMPKFDYFNYNYNFLTYEDLKKTHPEYIKIASTISNQKLYYPNVYGHCIILKFKKNYS
jgi:SAM-dependent methyltransferase